MERAFSAPVTSLPRSASQTGTGGWKRSTFKNVDVLAEAKVGAVVASSDVSFDSYRPLFSQILTDPVSDVTRQPWCPPQTHVFTHKHKHWGNWEVTSGS